MNYYPFHIGDYASATRHLSWLEDAAYRRLMDVYYVREEPLPLDHRQLYRLVVASTEEQREAVDVVLEEFFKLTDDGYRHERCDAEIAKKIEKSNKASISARASVLSREKRAAENRRLRINAAREKGTHTKEEWAALLSVCNNKCVICGSSDRIQKDHIEPIYQGGSDALDNLQPLCASCNSAKGPDKTDHRPTNWKRDVELMLNERSAFAFADFSERSTDASNSSSERYAPNPNPNPNPNIKKQKPAHAMPDGFAEFWSAYPKKVGKGAAEQAWKKHSPNLQDCLKAIALASKTDGWSKNGGQFIPNPATWLNQRRWEDEYGSAVSGNQAPKSISDAMLAITGTRNFV